MSKRNFVQDFDFQFMQNKGFTLVELIIVIILLGILSAITLPRFFNQTTFTDYYDRSEFDNAISWARNRAVTSQCTHEVRLTDTGWTVFRDNNDCSSTTIEPACVATSDSLDLSIIAKDVSNSELTGTAPTVSLANSPQRLIFTATGKLFLNTALPTTAGCTAIPGVPVVTETEISLLPSGTLSLDGETAYVELLP